MFASTQKMYDELVEKANQLQLSKRINLNELHGIIESAALMLNQLKDRVRQHQFKDEAEEIAFYKELKPKLYALYLYHVSVYQIETGKPIGSKKWKRKYFQNELKKIDDFFFHNLHFYKYYRSGQSQYDK